MPQAGRIGPLDLCRYNAGMDPYQGCVIGWLDGITAGVLAQREQIVFDWCPQEGLPVAFILAGRYIDLPCTQRMRMWAAMAEVVGAGIVIDPCSSPTPRLR